MKPKFAIKCEESIGLYEPLGLREDLIHFFNKNIKKKRKKKDFFKNIFDISILYRYIENI